MISNKKQENEKTSIDKANVTYVSFIYLKLTKYMPITILNNTSNFSRLADEGKRNRFVNLLSMSVGS